jgi:hypothetical protein
MHDPGTDPVLGDVLEKQDPSTVLDPGIKSFHLRLLPAWLSLLSILHGWRMAGCTTKCKLQYSGAGIAQQQQVVKQNN